MGALRMPGRGPHGQDWDEQPGPDALMARLSPRLKPANQGTAAKARANRSGFVFFEIRQLVPQVRSDFELFLVNGLL